MHPMYIPCWQIFSLGGETVFVMGTDCLARLLLIFERQGTHVHCWKEGRLHIWIGETGDCPKVAELQENPQIGIYAAGPR